MFWVLTWCLCFPLWSPSDLELLNEGLSAGKPNTNAADTSCVKYFAQRALIWTFTANTSGEKNLWRFKYKCLSGSSPIGPRKGIIRLFYFNIIFRLSVSLRGGTEVEVGQRTICRSHFFVYHVGPRKWTQVILLDSTCFHMLSRLIRPMWTF